MPVLCWSLDRRMAYYAWGQLIIDRQSRAIAVLLTCPAPQSISKDLGEDPVFAAACGSGAPALVSLDPAQIPGLEGRTVDAHGAYFLLQLARMNLLRKVVREDLPQVADFRQLTPFDVDDDVKVFTYV